MPSFGDLRGTLRGNGNSVTNPSDLTGSIAVSLADLIFVTFCQQTNLTAGAVSDNLGNVFIATNAGTDAGTSTGRSYYSRVTTAGTLTVVHVAATASTNDYAGIAAVFVGPFASGVVDQNPANGSDATSPFTCPSTGTLSKPDELVIGWMACGSSQTFSATAPNTMADQINNAANAKVVIGYQRVSVTSSVSPAFTAGVNPADATTGTISFFMDTTFLGSRLETITLGGETLIRPPHQIMGY